MGQEKREEYQNIIAPEENYHSSDGRVLEHHETSCTVLYLYLTHCQPLKTCNELSTCRSNTECSFLIHDANGQGEWLGRTSRCERSGRTLGALGRRERSGRMVRAKISNFDDLGFQRKISKFGENLSQKREKDAHATFWQIQSIVPGFVRI